MRGRPSIVFAALGLSTAAGSLLGCHDCDDDSRWLPPEVLELDVELSAVGELEDWVDDRWFIGLGVGPMGNVVAFSKEYQDPHWQVFADVHVVGDANWLGAFGNTEGWWVVGEGGAAARSTDQGETWEMLELGVTADLYAVTRAGITMTIVGDDVIVYEDRFEPGTWLQATVPSEGFGALRSISDTEFGAFAVGLGGVAWQADEPSFDDWAAADVGVDDDLFDVCVYTRKNGKQAVVVVGAEGTVRTMKREEGSSWILDPLLPDGWNEFWPLFDSNLDVIACSGSAVLDANGRVYDIAFEEEIGTVPKALGLVHAQRQHVIASGLGATAYFEYERGCVW